MEATTQVALAVHHAPGIYAVLVGSGVSRGAGVPTGWEVTLDLVRRLAVAEGDEGPEDPAAWYHGRYDADPDYSDVLEKLAATPEERQAWLRSYFEPTEEERADGIKCPTQAHHALADLVRRGLVRVILTTNFDPLIEQALDAAGVAADVWASPEAIQGGVPLSHGNNVVVKLHGDYRDTRLRNTLTELRDYDHRVNALLDQVLDEFGLVICGWSGVWDEALRAAILRAPNRRYRTFWASPRGDLADEAAELVAHRAATVVAITDADQFFGEVRDKVDALAEASQPHPASREMAVAMVKRYLPDQPDRVKLSDTVMDQARRLHEHIGPEHYTTTGSRLQVEDVVAVAERYEADTETMTHVLAHLAALADRRDHERLAARALELIANPEASSGGKVSLLALRRYPALLCFYAAGIGAVAAENWSLLRAVALDAEWRDPTRRESVLAAVHPYRVFENGDQVAQALAQAREGQKLHTPHSDRLHAVLRGPLLPLVDTDERYDEAFDRFEYLAGVLLTDERLAAEASDEPSPWVLPGYVGRVRWRSRYEQTPAVIQWADQKAEDIASALLSHTDAPAQRWAAAKEKYDAQLLQARAQAW